MSMTTTAQPYPGPGGMGGIPSGVRPMIVLTKPNPKGFYVELART